MRYLHKILLTVSLLLAPIASARALIVGTFNIRYDNEGDAKRGDGWTQRAPVVAGLIRFHNFDVLGTQEAVLHQIRDLGKLLPEHAHIGRGRDDGKDAGEHVAIFYKKDKFRLLDGGDFWLSETPDVPGKGWDADLPRICTWAKLGPADGENGAFFVFNVHFDHRGVQARLESSRLLLSKTKEIAGDQPVILMGDFNVDQNSESYRELTASGDLADAFGTASIRYALNGTFSSFNPDAMTRSRIDHVFLSKHFKPLRYGVLTDSYRAPVPQADGETTARDAPHEMKLQEFQARLPSDHFPVLVEVEF